MEDLQCDLVPEEEARSDTDTGRFENDVLRLRMELMAKEHMTEKNTIIKTKDNTIEELQTTNEKLNIEIGDQSDKMQQMDKRSVEKDKKIEALAKRANELLEQKNQLEINLKQEKERNEQSSVKQAQQDERIKKLESQLSEVKQQLEVIRIAKEEQIKLFATYLKKAEENAELREKRRQKEAEEKNERREKRQEKLIQDMMQKHHAEILSQIKSMDIKPKSPARKESKLSITDVHNVQISFDCSNGRNDAAFPTNASLKNSQICKPAKDSINLSK